MELVLAIVALIALDVASILWGADSRDRIGTSSEQPQGWPFAPGQSWTRRSR